MRRNFGPLERPTLLEVSTETQTLTSVVAYNDSTLRNIYFDSNNGWVVDAPFGETGRINVTVSGDVDGDGRDDVVTIRRDGSIVWYQTLADGRSFAEQSTSSVQGVAPDNAQLIDIDGDGRLDLVATSVLFPPIQWFPNVDGGGFGAGIALPLGFESISRFASGDFDQDGDNDIVYSSLTNQQMRWLENDGAGNFTQHEIVTTTELAGELIVLDFDSDGDEDILGASFWLENRLNEQSGFRRNSLMSGRQFAVADFDEDGDLDFVRSDGQLTYLPRLEDAIRLAPTQLLDPDVRADKVFAGDFAILPA